MNFQLGSNHYKAKFFNNVHVVQENTTTSRRRAQRIRLINRYHDLSALRTTILEYMANAEVKFVDWNYLRSLVGTPLPKHQDISEDQFKEALGEEEILVTSHPLHSEGHPDPRGVKIQQMITGFKVFADNYSLPDESALGVSADYCSLPQMTFDGNIVVPGRTPSEQLIFERALDDVMHMFYVSNTTLPVVLNELIPANLSDKKYEDRAQLRMQQHLLTKAVDEGAAVAPKTPEAFRADIEAKHFVNGRTDSDVVAQLYKRCSPSSVQQRRFCRLVRRSTTPWITNSLQTSSAPSPASQVWQGW